MDVAVGEVVNNFAEESSVHARYLLKFGLGGMHNATAVDCWIFPGSYYTTSFFTVPCLCPVARSPSAKIPTNCSAFLLAVLLFTLGCAATFALFVLVDPAGVVKNLVVVSKYLDPLLVLTIVYY